MLLETQFLISLLLTLIVEVPVLLILTRYVFKLKNFYFFHVLFVGIIASALTLPYLWFILPTYIDLAYYVVAGEILVTLVEALIYNRLLKLNILNSLAVSIIANAASFFLGLTLFNNIIS